MTTISKTAINDSTLERKRNELITTLDNASKNFILIGKQLNAIQKEFGDVIASEMTDIAFEKGFSYPNLQKYKQVSRRFSCKIRN